jgi:hypothetical protein
LAWSTAWAIHTVNAVAAGSPVPTVNAVAAVSTCGSCFALRPADNNYVTGTQQRFSVQRLDSLPRHQQLLILSQRYLQTVNSNEAFGFYGY